MKTKSGREVTNIRYRPAASGTKCYALVGDIAGEGLGSWTISGEFVCGRKNSLDLILPIIDDEGWILNTGVAPDCKRAEVKLRDGTGHDGRTDDFDFTLLNNRSNDIIWYRPITKRETKGWRLRYTTKMGVKHRVDYPSDQHIRAKAEERMAHESDCNNVKLTRLV